MAALVAAIHATRALARGSTVQELESCRPSCRNANMAGGWVYIMTNRPNGTLYVGVTSDLARRAWEHRQGTIPGFTRRYRLKRLVYAEYHENIRNAIQRESTIKHWPRAWRANLILGQNPDWSDLYDQLTSHV